MARFRLLFILSLMVAIGGNSLQAADHPNFSGIWTLELNAPETTSLEAMLEAQGVPWIKRKVMNTMPLTQVITQTDKTLTIKIETTMGIYTQIMTLDGNTEIRDMGLNIGKAASRSFWDKHGTVIVNVIKYATPDDQKAEWTTRRYLQDKGRTLIVDHSLTLNDGWKLTGKRVLRKQ
jgi:hypothetical protein